MTTDPSFQHKKSLGQHFLNSDVVPRWMCDAANITPADTVLEIGPGTGALTKVLLERGATVKAVETDDRAVAALKHTFASELADTKLRIEESDMREVSTHDLAQRLSLADHSFKLVANIPYYLSGFLFRTFLQSPIQPSLMVFLVQKEVATRIARDKKESLLSLSIKAYGKPTYIRTVRKGHFTPAPAIDSAIVLIEHISRNNFTELDEQHFFSLLHVGFGQKRKQLLGNLSVVYERPFLTEVFTSLGLSLTIRAEDLSIETWLNLAKQLPTQ